MAEKKTTTIVIDGVEHDFNEMTHDQQIMVNHIADLDRKIGSTQFNLQQLQVGKDAFIQMLKTSLAAKAEEVTDVAVQ